MKQHFLFLRVVIQGLWITFTFFLLQGCFCKDCAMAVSKAKPGSPSFQTNNQIAGNQSGTVFNQVAGEAGTTTEETNFRIAVLKEDQTLTSVDQGITLPDISRATIFPTVTNPGNDQANLQTLSLNVQQEYVQIEKRNTSKFVAGKSCPLGIRSISSQIIAGPNISFKSSNEGKDVYGNNAQKHQPGPGFQVGLGYNLEFNDKFSVSPSILLKQNNASEKIKYMNTDPGSPNGGESNDKYKYTSLSAPVVANYKVGKQVQVFAGPEINYLLKASVKRKGGTGTDDKENITSNSAKVGVGIQAGVKYSIPAGNGDSPFGLQLLYEHRLSRLNKKGSDGYSYNSPAWNMQGFQLGVTCSICNLMKGIK